MATIFITSPHYKVLYLKLSLFSYIKVSIRNLLLLTYLQMVSTTKTGQDGGWEMMEVYYKITLNAVSIIQYCYLCVDGWNSHNFHIEYSSMVVDPLHPWEWNLKDNNNTWANLYHTDKMNISLGLRTTAPYHAYNINEVLKLIYLFFLKNTVLHLGREQSRIVVVFPKTQANRSVPFVVAHSATLGSTGKTGNDNVNIFNWILIFNSRFQICTFL